MIASGDGDNFDKKTSESLYLSLRDSQNNKKRKGRQNAAQQIYYIKMHGGVSMNRVIICADSAVYTTKL